MQEGMVSICFPLSEKGLLVEGGGQREEDWLIDQPSLVQQDFADVLSAPLHSMLETGMERREDHAVWLSFI